MKQLRMEYFKELDAIRKDMKKLIFECISGAYDELLSNMENVFGEQLNNYIMKVYELDEMIDNYDNQNINDIEKLIEDLNDNKQEILKLLLDIEMLFMKNSVETYKKGLKNGIEKRIISNFNRKYTKSLLRSYIKEEIIKSQNILEEYYKDQQENLNKYYELFIHQDKIISNFYVLKEKKERLLNPDIKRFTCTYLQMEDFLKSKGYKKVRQNGTSHAIYRNEKGHSLPLPNKHGEMCASTISLILNQCNSNRNELGKFIKL